MDLVTFRLISKYMPLKLQWTVYLISYWRDFYMLSVPGDMWQYISLYFCVLLTNWRQKLNLRFDICSFHQFIVVDELSWLLIWIRNEPGLAIAGFWAADEEPLTKEGATQTRICQARSLIIRSQIDKAGFSLKVQIVIWSYWWGLENQFYNSWVLNDTGTVCVYTYRAL